MARTTTSCPNKAAMSSGSPMRTVALATPASRDTCPFRQVTHEVIRLDSRTLTTVSFVVASHATERKPTVAPRSRERMMATEPASVSSPLWRLRSPITATVGRLTRVHAFGCRWLSAKTGKSISSRGFGPVCHRQVSSLEFHRRNRPPPSLSRGEQCPQRMQARLQPGTSPAVISSSENGSALSGLRKASASENWPNGRGSAARTSAISSADAARIPV